MLRDALRQCVVGAASIIFLEYILRLDLSRSFVGIFAVSSWILLCLFRLNAGRVVRAVLREFGTAHYVMVVGLGEPARKLGRQIEDASGYGVRLSGFLADDNSGGDVELVAAIPCGRFHRFRTCCANISSTRLFSRSIAAGWRSWRKSFCCAMRKA